MSVRRHFIIAVIVRLSAVWWQGDGRRTMTIVVLLFLYVRIMIGRFSFFRSSLIIFGSLFVFQIEFHPATHRSPTITHPSPIFIQSPTIRPQTKYCTHTMMLTICSQLPILMMWLVRLHLCTMSVTSFTGVRQDVSRSKSQLQSRWIGIAHLPQYMRNDNCIIHRRIGRFSHSMDGSLQESQSVAADYIVERELRFAGVAR